MIDHPHNPDDSIDPVDPDCVEAVDRHDDDDDRVDVIFFGPAQRSAPDYARDLYDLGWLFLCWVQRAGYRDWTKGVRALARALRGLEQTGLIERRTIRRSGRPTHHGFVLTDEGRQAVSALSGDWIKEVDR